MRMRRMEPVLLGTPRLVLVTESRAAQRFAALFNDVWARVSDVHRHRLAYGWRARSGQEPPRVELRDLSDLGRDVSTDVDEHGRVMRFDSTLFDHAPPSLVQSGIAFVLAAASICMGERARRLNEFLDPFAHSLAADWGFPISRNDERVVERWLHTRPRGADRTARGGRR